MSEASKAPAEPDETLEALRGMAKFIEEAFGRPPAVSVPDWHFAKEEHLVSWVWLIPAGTNRDYKVNCGFRFHQRGDRQRLEAWGHGNRLELSAAHGGLTNFPGLQTMIHTVISAQPRTDTDNRPLHGL
jgi:hypothetical protein